MDKPTFVVAVVPSLEVNPFKLLWADTQNYPRERFIYIILLILSVPFRSAGVGLYGNCPHVTAGQSAPFLKKKAMIVLALVAEGGIVVCHFMDGL